jgi:DNA-binding MarR family transcriptional regulator
MPAAASMRDEAVDRIWEAVPPLWGAVRSHIRMLAAHQHNITVEQFHVLWYVHHGTGSVSELATARSISRPAISQAVDVLVRKGLVKRVQSTRDRRFIGLSLTEAGKALLGSLFDETHQWMKERMKILTGAELECIVKAMPALRKILEDAGASSRNKR